MKKIEESILSCIRKTSQKYYDEKRFDDVGVSAEDLSWKLKKDRANISRIINTLWKQGYLIKIIGRPVMYLDYISLKKLYPNGNIPTFINKNDKLSNYLFIRADKSAAAGKKTPNLDDLIGAQGSLSEQIEKAKAAVSYPPYGLQTIIVGSSGTEKLEIALGMVNYAKTANLKNANSLYYLIDCQYYSDPLAFEKLVFGDYENKGLLEKAGLHFLIFESIEYLSMHSLRLLSELLNRNFYLKNNKQIDLECMCIFTTGVSAEDEKIQTISIYCPIKIKLNDIDLRGNYEKMELVLHLFLKEAYNVKRTLKVSKDVLYAIVKSKHQLNMIDLKNQIKLTCSNAFLESTNLHLSYVRVNLHNLPQETLQLTSQELSINEYSNQLLNIIQGDTVTFEENGISKDYEAFKNFPKKSASHLFSQFIDKFNFDLSDLSAIDSYASENIACLTNLGKNQLLSLKKNIDPFVYQVTVSVLFKYPKYEKLKEHEELLYGILLHITNNVSRKHHVESNAAAHSLSSIYPQEYKIAEEIFANLYTHYELQEDIREINFLTNYLVIANQWANKTKVALLVIAHGESIASQMADYIRENISGSYHLDAIDFKKTLQLNDCMELACVKAIKLNQGSGVLVISDKEPLNSISEYITSQTNIPSRNVSGLSLELLIGLVQRTMSSICDLSSLVGNDTHVKAAVFSEDKYHFIENITKRVISKTLEFLDAEKAVNVLSECLHKTLNAINIPFSNEIATKYLCHGANMIERVIKHEAWDNPRANKFMRNYAELLQIVEDSLELVNNSFGIKIPKNELVYLSEIFLPYIEEKELLQIDS